MWYRLLMRMQMNVENIQEKKEKNRNHLNYKEKKNQPKHRMHVAENITAMGIVDKRALPW